jgi:hypothetical protein
VLPTVLHQKILASAMDLAINGKPAKQTLREWSRLMQCFFLLSFKSGHACAPLMCSHRWSFPQPSANLYIAASLSDAVWSWSTPIQTPPFSPPPSPAPSSTPFPIRSSIERSFPP